MKNKSMKTFTLMLVSSALISCGGETNPSYSQGKPTPTEIVIYAGGSSEYSWSKGKEEADVIRAVQDKYYEDTGRNLKFNISYLG